MFTQIVCPEIKHLSEFNPETLFGATITRLLSQDKLSTVGFDHVKIARGSAFQSHIHITSESFIYILSGKAVVTLDNRRFYVAAGDTIYIPAGTSHGFSTPDEEVVLLSVQSPPIYPEQSTPDICFSNSRHSEAASPSRTRTLPENTTSSVD